MTLLAVSRLSAVSELPPGAVRGAGAAAAAWGAAALSVGSVTLLDGGGASASAGLASAMDRQRAFIGAGSTSSSASAPLDRTRAVAGHGAAASAADAPFLARTLLFSGSGASAAHVEGGLSALTSKAISARGLGASSASGHLTGTWAMAGEGSASSAAEADVTRLVGLQGSGAGASGSDGELVQPVTAVQLDGQGASASSWSASRLVPFYVYSMVNTTAAEKYIVALDMFDKKVVRERSLMAAARPHDPNANGIEQADWMSVHGDAIYLTRGPINTGIDFYWQYSLLDDTSTLINIDLALIHASHAPNDIIMHDMADQDDTYQWWALYAWNDGTSDYTRYLARIDKSTWTMDTLHVIEDPVDFGAGPYGSGFVGLAWDSVNGELLVASQQTATIYRHSPADGSVIGTFTGPSGRRALSHRAFNGQLVGISSLSGGHKHFARYSAAGALQDSFLLSEVTGGVDKSSGYPESNGDIGKNLYFVITPLGDAVGASANAAYSSGLGFAMLSGEGTSASVAEGNLGLGGLVGLWVSDTDFTYTGDTVDNHLLLYGRDQTQTRDITLTSAMEAHDILDLARGPNGGLWAMMKGDTAPGVGRAHQLHPSTGAVVDTIEFTSPHGTYSHLNGEGLAWRFGELWVIVMDDPSQGADAQQNKPYLCRVNPDTLVLEGYYAITNVPDTAHTHPMAYVPEADFFLIPSTEYSFFSEWHIDVMSIRPDGTGAATGFKHRQNPTADNSKLIRGLDYFEGAAYFIDGARILYKRAFTPGSGFGAQTTYDNISADVSTNGPVGIAWGEFGLTLQLEGSGDAASHAESVVDFGITPLMGSGASACGAWGKVAALPPSTLHPDGDVSNAGWAFAPLWQAVDEDPASDADFINDQQTAVMCELRLGDPASVEAGTQTVHVRARKDASGGNDRSLQIDLMQGGATVATWTIGGLTSIWTTYSNALTQPQVDSIVNYNDLRIRLTSGGSTGGNPGNRRTVQVSQVLYELPAPSAPPTPY